MALFMRLSKITVLNIDSDDIQFQVQIESYCCKTSLDFYGYADEFKEFGHKLIDFPKASQTPLYFKSEKMTENGLTICS